MRAKSRSKKSDNTVTTMMQVLVEEARLASDMRGIRMWLSEERDRQLRAGFLEGELSVAVNDADALTVLKWLVLENKMPERTARFMTAIANEDPWTELKTLRVCGLRLAKE